MKIIRTIKVGPDAPDSNSLWLYKNTAKYFNNGKWTEIKEEEIKPIKWDGIKDKPNLSEVATSGSYNDLSDKPTQYTLPVATNSKIGGVKMGTKITNLTNESTLEQVVKGYNDLLEVLRVAGLISK